MKKILALTLAAGMAFMAGCGDSAAETEEAAPETSESAESAESAYQKVIDEYREAAEDEAFLNYPGDREELNERYPDILGDIIYFYFREPGSEYDVSYSALYYCFWDINGDGQEELVIGALAEDGSTVPVEIYTYHDGEVTKVIETDAVMDREDLCFSESGIIVFSGSDIEEESIFFEFFSIGEEDSRVTQILKYEYFLSQDQGFLTQDGEETEMSIEDFEDYTLDMTSENTIGDELEWVEITSTGEIPTGEDSGEEDEEAQPQDEESADLASEEPEPADPIAVGEDAGEVWQILLDEYLEAAEDVTYDEMELSEEEISSFDAYCGQTYPDVSVSLMACFHAAGYEQYKDLYYSFYDINGDGQEELLLGVSSCYEDAMGGVHGTEGSYIPLAIHTFDGERAQKAVSGDDLGSPAFLREIAVYQNGCMVKIYTDEGGGGADFYVLDSDGCTATETTSYTVYLEYYGDGSEGYAFDWSGEIEVLTRDEMETAWEEQTDQTEPAAPEWISLIARQEAEEQDTEADDTPALKGLYDLVASNWEEGGTIRYTDAESGVSWVVNQDHCSEFECEETGFYGTITDEDGTRQGYYILPYRTHVSGLVGLDATLDCDLWGYYFVPCDGRNEEGKLIEPGWDELGKAETGYSTREEALADIYQKFEGVN